MCVYVSMCIYCVSNGLLHIKSDETVEVGANLYEIDTEAEATVSAADPAAAPAPVSVEAPSAAAKTAAPPASVATSIPAQDNSRKPSIGFLGKTGWATKLSGAPPQPQSLVPDKPNGVVVLDGTMLTASYGRPAFSEEEMEALILGGANVAPSVISVSHGALFSS